MSRLRSVVAGALLSLVLGGAPALTPSASAQVAVSPSAIEVTVPAGEQVTRALTVTGGGSDTLALALSLAPAPSPDAPPEAPGEVLFTSEEMGSIPGGITMTPGGRVFVESDLETFEFTPELTFVREFEHPRSAFLSATVGITHDADSGGDGGPGSLWWTDTDSEDGEIVSALLLEGDLDGEPSGRELALSWVDTTPCGSSGGLVVDAVYDAVTTGGSGLFYWLDVTNETIWAMDPDGTVAEGYPVPLTDYAGIPQPDNPAGCLVTSGLDAHTLSNRPGEQGEPLLEAVTGYPFVHPRNRQYTVVVMDREGRNRGTETPLFDLPTPDGFGDVRWVSDIVRSRLNPSVLYLTVITGFTGNGRYWVYAVRAAPLPPVWLRADPILFELEGETATELTLRLDASGLAPGAYEAVASVRSGDGIGPVVAEVPVELTVTEGTAAEDGAEVAAAALTVYPNPAGGRATVEVALEQPTEVRVAMFDVLGREVAVLHEGPLAVGTARFTLPVLPNGSYVVRATGTGFSKTQRVTIVR